MADLTATLIFDAGPLSCFARAERMDALRDIASDARCVVTDVVLQEIERGVPAYPELQAVLDADWLDHVRLERLDELGLFAEYARVLGSSREKDRGEAATLAWAEAHGATAIVDERAATNVGRQRRVSTHGTLWLVLQGVNAGRLTEGQADAIVGALLETGSWLPFGSAGEFIPWARREGLLG